MRTGDPVSSKASIKGTASFRPKQTIVRTSPKLGITRLPELFPDPWPGGVLGLSRYKSR